MRALTAFMRVLTAFEGVTDRPPALLRRGFLTAGRTLWYVMQFGGEADQTDLHVMSALGRVLRTRNERAVWEALAEEEHRVLVLDGSEKVHLE